MSMVDDQVKTYIVVKSAVCAGLGVVVSVVLGVLGVDLAIVFGILTAVANYVPTVGAIVATLLPLPLVVLDPDVGLTRGLVVLAVLLAVHAVNGNIVEPKLLGDLAAVPLCCPAMPVRLCVWPAAVPVPACLCADLPTPVGAVCLPCTRCVACSPCCAVWPCAMLQYSAAVSPEALPSACVPDPQVLRISVL